MAEYLRRDRSAAPTPPATPTQPPAAPDASPAGAQPPAATPQEAAPATPATTVPPLEEFSFDEEEEGEKPKEAASPAESTEDPEKDAVSRLQALLESGGLPKEVESAFLATQRGKNILQTFKIMRDLQLPPDKGGIGAIPTVEQIKDWYQARGNWEAASYEFETNPESFLLNWIRGEGGVTQQGLRFIDTFLPTIHQLDPTGNLFNRVTAPVIRAQVSSLYAAAQNMPEGTNKDQFGVDERSRLIDAAQILEYRTFGKLSPGAVGGNGQPAPAATGTPSGPRPADPLAAERAALQRERQAIAQQQNQIVQEQIASVQTAITSSVESSVDKDIDALAKAYKVREVMPSDEVYHLWRENFRRTVIQTVSGDASQGISPMNPTGFDSFKISVNRASAAGARGQNGSAISPNAHQSQAIQQYQQMARIAIRQLAPNYVKVAGEKLLASLPSPAQVQQRVDVAAATKEPVASGPPVQHSLAPPVQFEIKSGESREEAMARHLRESASVQTLARGLTAQLTR